MAMKDKQALVLLGICLITVFVHAQEEQLPPTVADGMNNARISELLNKLELEAVGGDGRWRLVLQGSRGDRSHRRIG